MQIHPLTAPDIPRWIELRAKLWPHEDPAGLDAQGRAALAASPPWRVLVAEDDGRLVGLLDLALRPYADGCDSSPVPYVEGWYVEDSYRRPKHPAIESQPTEPESTKEKPDEGE